MREIFKNLRKMCTFEQEIRKTSIQKINWHNLTKVLKNFTFLYGILSQFLCAKFSVRKFACAKKITFRRSD